MFDRKENDRVYREKNKDSIAARNKEWRAKNKERVKEEKRIKIASNPEFYRARDKGYRQTFVGRFHTLRGSARNKNLEVTLTKREFINLVSNPCSYCGEVNENRGIDRIDNSTGYTSLNSAPACRLCNFMKKAMSVETFLSHIQKIYIHNAK